MKTEPWPHQLKEYEASKDLEARALLWQMRTGKTKTAIDVMSYKHRQGQITSLLVVTLNGVHVNWLSELETHAWTDYEAIAWTSKSDRRVGFGDRLDQVLAAPGRGRLAVVTCSFESIRADDFVNAVKKLLSKGPAMLVVDESQKCGAPGTKTFKRLRSLARRCAFRWILTGTPVANSPLRAWPQFELLMPKALGFQTFTEFKEHICIQETTRGPGGVQFPKVIGYRNLDWLQAELSRWSSVITRGDPGCGLPPLVPYDLVYRPTELQLDVYRRLAEQDLELVAAGEMVGLEGSVLILRRQQVLSNFYVNKDGELETVDPDTDARADALSNELAGLKGEKFIVWCAFREDTRRVANRLWSDGRRIVVLHGGIPAEDRVAAIKRLREEDELEGLVATPGSVGRGHTISGPTVMIWYSHLFDAEIRAQANERATVAFGRSVILGNTIASTAGAGMGVDRYILENTSNKEIISHNLAGGGLSKLLEALSL